MSCRTADGNSSHVGVGDEIDGMPADLFEKLLGLGMWIEVRVQRLQGVEAASGCPATRNFGPSEARCPLAMRGAVIVSTTLPHHVAGMSDSSHCCTGLTVVHSVSVDKCLMGRTVM